MRVIDVLINLDKNTRIKVYTPEHEMGILYTSPLSAAIRNKYELEIKKMIVRNNILHIYTVSESNEKEE